MEYWPLPLCGDCESSDTGECDEHKEVRLGYVCTRECGDGETFCDECKD